MAKRSRRREQEEHIDESWLIPYADVLTLLLALFIVLFASSSVDSKKFQNMMISFNSVLNGGSGVMDVGTIVSLGEEFAHLGINGKDRGSPKDTTETSDEEPLTELQKRIQEETIQLENLKQEIDAYIVENGLDSQLTTELNNFQLALRISDNALYASGSATVRDDARSLALAIAKMLVAYPQYEVIVSGHTDDRPINTPQFRDNWDLSTARALNFMKILLSNKDLDPARFSSIGYGEYRPVAPNDDAAGRAANRRVEVSIIRNIVETPVEDISVR